jgi:hypothetical protein
MKLLKAGTALFLCCCMLGASAQDGFAYQAGGPISQSAPQSVQESAEQLQQLVAPIALYPDALVAQILAAATYPTEIVEAQKWVQLHRDWTGDKLAKEVDKQSWDPSVKALAQFRVVLDNMNQNLAWTSELGDAYINQPQDVKQAIQTMRQRAQQAGNLKSTGQETVTNNGQTIVIQPASPEVVYVPQYDPWLVYGAPISVFPGWYPYPGLFVDGPGITFGLGFGIGLFAGFGWGWHHWGFDWHGPGRVIYNHNTFISHSTTIVNRNSFRVDRGGFARAANFHGGGFAAHGDFGHGGFSHAAMRSSAFSGFNHGGFARASSFRGSASFGGFHGGGFHGGGGRR